MTTNIVERDGYAITVFAAGAIKGGHRAVQITTTGGGFITLHERDWNQFSIDVFHTKIELAGGGSKLSAPVPGFSVRVATARRLFVGLAAIGAAILFVSLPPLMWLLVVAIGIAAFWGGFGFGIDFACAQISGGEVQRLKEVLEATSRTDENE